MQHRELEGRTALITGGSAGIGLALAHKLVALGCRVAVVARDSRRLDEAVAALGPNAQGFALDVTDYSALARLPHDVVAAFGRLDFVVNNAGRNHRGPLLEQTPEQLAAIVMTNLASPIYLSRVCADVIRPGGAIVNVASIAGMVPVHHEAAYSASKAGLRAFSRVADEELRTHDITVSTVCPGPVDTGFLGDLQQLPDLVLSQPMSTADDVADVIVRVLRERKRELAIPALSGKLATIGYLSPWFLRVARPFFERIGARRKRGALSRSR